MQLADAGDLQFRPPRSTRAHRCALAMVAAPCVCEGGSASEVMHSGCTFRYPIVNPGHMEWCVLFIVHGMDHSVRV